MDYLLHIDTSADTGTVAISGNGQILHFVSSEDTHNYASIINTMINEALDTVGITLQRIKAFVVCAGPGSYTGLRIGLATAKAFCYTLDKPLILNNKLTLLAHQEFAKHGSGFDIYCSILKAREKEYFISLYDSFFKCIMEPQHIVESDLRELDFINKKVLVIGDISDDFGNLMSVKEVKMIENNKIDLNTWIISAYDDFKCNKTVNLSLAEPFYLKQVYTHKSKNIN
ncbi:MAG TPA: tRNA (adenosine(37)-N6)-threonylcarbamoyltransferase complex dimerization subunit type 1 TsaB [Flavipsychrobacter sp.]|nr:tRNA (adenosine(37)-N6)-threonylcarbamoyltransferase complex dimerization subunit type 1 TsaB [Flavipsychrobacter sp.]